MLYLITFLEGVISFISPCMLPMLPIYISYFAGSNGDKRRIFPRALSFVLGFTIVFSLLGLFAGSLGALLIRYKTAVNIISGIIVTVLGLSFLEIIRIPLFKGMNSRIKINGVISAFVFGVIFSISLTPCVGAFLGSALTLAASQSESVRGVLLLITYSLGMGIPFLLSAVLIEELTGLFDTIKKHYRGINVICGSFLIIVGVSMMFGWLNALLNILS